MRKNTAQVLNVEDCIGVDGLWKKSYCREFPSVIVQYRTRASLLWENINKRSEPGGSYQRKNKTYEGCTNKFLSFQDFAEWCNCQFGYGIPGWHIDKDLLADGDISYSPEKCVFLPSRVNQMITAFSKDGKGVLPKGVFFSGSKFSAKVSNGYGGAQYLGSFESQEEAARVALDARASLLRQEMIAMNHENPKVMSAINAVISKMLSHEGSK